MVLVVVPVSLVASVRHCHLLASTKPHPYLSHFLNISIHILQKHRILPHSFFYLYYPEWSFRYLETRIELFARSEAVASAPSPFLLSTLNNNINGV